MAILWLSGLFVTARAQGFLEDDDSTKTKDYKPSFRPRLNWSDRLGDKFSNPPSRSPLYLEDPDNIKTKVEVDSQSRTYTIYEQVGQLDFRPVSTMTFEQYEKYMEAKLQKNYLKAKAEGADGESPTTGRSLIPKIYLSPMLDRIFGGNFIDIRPNGSVMLDFGGQFQKIANPNVPIRQQRFGNFQFDQQINVSVQGKIGEKLKMNINFDTKAAFDFDNQIKLDYTGKDHEIIQKLEAGNVSMPLSSTLITGAQNLFGVKTTLQFGKLKVTTVASNQRGKANRLKLKGGVTSREFLVPCNQYEANRHFFLAQEFRNSYERALKTLPQITSGLNITRVEVYVTNRAGNTQSLRNVLPLIDLGEANPLKPSWKKSGVKFRDPSDNKNNTLYSTILGKGADVLSGENTRATLEGMGLQRSTDYEFLKGARKLIQDKDFKVQKQLGYISLNFALRDDEVLGVAYEYSLNGVVFKVGELQEDYAAREQSEVVILKLLRPAVINTKLPTWDLQMKNIYNLGTSQIGANNFQLRVIYRDDATGVDNPAMPTGSGRNLSDKPLVQVFNLDRLNPGGELQPDGNFDFVEDITIDSKNGRIMFPVLEPFGNTLEKQFVLPDEIQLADKYVFKDLYRLTQPDALQAANKAKFFIKGRMEGASSSEVSLPGVNIAPGSVKLYSGSTLLQPEVDYTVDPSLGRIKILNTGLLSSGQDLEVEFEQADLFSFQQRSFFGSRFDYTVSKNINFGGTLLYLNERPIIRRVQVGNEPSQNVMAGIDANYKSDSRLLTKIIDALPLIQTKETSTVTASMEYARLFPGTNKFVDPTGKGISFLDDFEGVRTPYSMGGQVTRWKLPSVPVGWEGQGYRISDPSTWIRLNDRRARTSWYIIDNLFYRATGSVKPGNIDAEDTKLHYVRAVGPQEIFPNRDLNAVNLNETIFDMAYYPQERGQYNFNTDLTPEGKLKDPRNNWGGIMRSINTDTDFDAANIEYMEFWMMDPFISGPLGAIEGKEYEPGSRTREGTFTVDLGNISEDVLRDNKLSFEQGLPEQGGTAETETSVFGKVPKGQIITYAFGNAPAARPNQDVGLDGLTNDEEKTQFSGYVEQVRNIGLNPEALAKIEADPANDDFRYFLDATFDQEDAKILERYKDFNHVQGNSPIGGTALFTPSYTNQPDMEDINQDNTLSDLDAYYSYNIKLQEDQMEVGKNYIIDKIEGNGYSWYLFRIPIKDKTHPNFGGVTGNIADFKTLRFLRLRLSGMSDPVVLRMAMFQYVGSQWRPFPKRLSGAGVFYDNEDKGALRIGTVNIEENGTRVEGQKTPYVTPPGAQTRDRDITSGVNRRLNEQSLQLCADNLADGDAKAAFKNVTFDFLNYKRLQMFVHAETPLNSGTRDDDTQLFVRLGTDFNENFYEVVIPMKLTALGESDPERIWPNVNALNIAFEDLIKAKLERNSTGINYQIRYKYSVPIINGEQRPEVYVVGNPDLNSVMTVMIGVRNPGGSVGNDGFSKSVCLWLNELRVTDFDKNDGWATTGRVNLKLADFAVVNMSGKYSTPGFGSIEQKISERSRETFGTFNISSNVTLDKFIPRNWGLKIPMFVSYENTTITPKFDPLNPDVKVDMIKQEGNFKDYKKFIQDKTEKKAINFTNVAKVKTGTNQKSHLWDVENLNFTYSRSEIIRSNVNIHSYTSTNTMYALGYNYTSNAKPIEPFKNVKFLNSKYLKLIKEVNFSYLPSSITVRGDINRIFTRTQLRGSDVFSPILPVGLLNFEKSFFFNRNYGLRYSPFKSLTFDYTANVAALVDEPTGNIDETEIRPGFTRKDSVIKNLKKLGRKKRFDQNIRLGYRLPLDKIPGLDWTSADAAYSANYLWTAAALGLSDDSARFLGNKIENSRDISINGRLDLVKLYNKSKWLNSINNPKPKPKKAAAKVDPKNAKKAPPAKKPIKKTKAQLEKEKKAEKLKAEKEKAKADSLSKAGGKGLPDQKGKGKEKEKEKADTAKKKPAELKVLKAIVRAIMSVRNVNFSAT
jgi:cell surface protein SprA